MESPQIEPFTITNNDPTRMMELLRTLANMLESGEFQHHTGGIIVTPRTILWDGFNGPSQQGIAINCNLVLAHRKA